MSYTQADIDALVTTHYKPEVHLSTRTAKGLVFRALNVPTTEYHSHAADVTELADMVILLIWPIFAAPLVFGLAFLASRYLDITFSSELHWMYHFLLWVNTSMYCMGIIMHLKKYIRRASQAGTGMA